MNQFTCNYTVVRYVPNVLRDEPVNIGVILQCTEVAFISGIFAKNFETRLRGQVNPGDKVVLSAYVQGFQQQFSHYSSVSQKGLFASSDAKILQTDYLVQLSRQRSSKLQFSELKTATTSDPETELERLYNTFVGEVEHPNAVKRSRFKSVVKKDLVSAKLIRTNNGIKLNATVSGGISKLRHPIDFVYANGKTTAIEAVDINRSQHSDVFEAAFKFEDLRYGLKDKIRTISVVPVPQKTGGYLLDVLSSTSEIFIYDDVGKTQLLSELTKIIV